jgi:hypothetical protein
MMAIQAEDTKTADIFDMTGAKMNDESEGTEEAEDLHLAAHHHLVKVQAYIRDEKKAEKKTAIAERVAKHREKQRSAGLVSVAIPATVAEAIKKLDGGFDAWLESQKVAPVEIEKVVEVVKEVPGPERVVEVLKEVPGSERIVEVIKVVPAVLTSDQERLIGLGRSIESLTGWRRWLVAACL